MNPDQEFDKRIASIHELDNVTPRNRNIEEGTMDLRHEEFQAMADVFLGETFDPVKLGQIEGLQIALHEGQAELYQRYENAELTAEEYVDSFNKLLSDTFAACEEILGQQDFLKLFGAPQSQLAGLIDKEAFLREVGIEPQPKKVQRRRVRLGDVAPDFRGVTTQGVISFHEWIGDSWAVLFSHTSDFSGVSTTELGEVARIKPELDRRNVKIIGVSVDPADSYEDWAEDIEETQGWKPNFPIIADRDREVSDLYDMIHPNASDTFTVRSVYVIGPDKKVKLMITYPANTGRNFDELLRVIDSLQLTARYSVATPVNWNQGDDVIIVPAVSDEEAKQKFPGGWKTLKPYLRIVSQPSKEKGKIA